MPIQGALAQMMLLPICIREGPVCPTTDYIYNESWHLHAVNSLRANWATYVSWREKELTVCVHLWCSTSSSGWPGAKSIIFSTMFGYFFRSLFTFRKIKQGGLWWCSDSHFGQPLVVGGVANSLGVTRLRKITQHEAPDQFLKPVATQLQWERNYSQRRTSGALIQFRLAASGVSPRDGLKFSCQPGSCQSDARSRAADERQSDTSSSASCVVRCQWHISPRHCNSPDGGGGSGERHPTLHQHHSHHHILCRNQMRSDTESRTQYSTHQEEKAFCFCTFRLFIEISSSLNPPLKPHQKDRVSTQFALLIYYLIL